MLTYFKNRMQAPDLQNILPFMTRLLSVISVHSLSVCLLYFMLAALVANKRIHKFIVRWTYGSDLQRAEISVENIVT